jgi:hypothetical protein
MLHDKRRGSKLLLWSASDCLWNLWKHVSIVIRSKNAYPTDHSPKAVYMRYLKTWDNREKTSRSGTERELHAQGISTQR